MNGIAFEDIEFKESPTTIVEEAIHEYELTRHDLYPDEQARTWSLLAHQVIGHENPPN